MSLRYSIQPLNFQPNKFRAVVHAGEMRSFEAFQRFAATQSTVSAADVSAVFTAAREWILMATQDGRECDLGPLGRSRLALRGTFDTYPKELTGDMVRLNISWIVPRSLQEEAAKIGRRLIRQETVAAGHGPVISAVFGLFDDQKGWQKDSWDAGTVLHIRGDWLKFDQHDPEQGVFLHAESGKVVRVRLYSELFKQNIKGLVPPELTGAGTLRVEVKRRAAPDNALYESVYRRPIVEASEQFRS